MFINSLFKKNILREVKTATYIVTFMGMFLSCSFMPQEVYPEDISSNSDGLYYKGKLYTGKVLGKQGYLLVKNGIPTNMIMCHDNGKTAIDMNFQKQIMSFKDKNGNIITKERFLSLYPEFRDKTDWSQVERL